MIDNEKNFIKKFIRWLKTEFSQKQDLKIDIE